MRSTRTRLLAAAAVLPLALLAACGDDSQDSSASSGSASTKPTPLSVAPTAVTPITAANVGAKDPKKPTLTVSKKPFQVNKTTTRVTKPGTGKTVRSKDIAYVSYVAVNGTTGKTIESTFGKPNAAFNLGNPSTFPGLVSALKGKKVGTEMVVAVPPAEGFGAAGNKGVGITAKDTMLFYVKVNNSMPILKEIKGKQTQAPDAKLPRVTVPAGPSTLAKITVPKGVKPPTKTVSHELITGEGPKLVEGQTVLVSYTGQIWSSGKIFDATARQQGKQPATFSLTTKPSQGQQGVIPGYVKGLVGHPVGSRVLIVMPPADGYGKAGNPQGGIKGTDTLVFVVDILAAI